MLVAGLAIFYLNGISKYRLEEIIFALKLFESHLQKKLLTYSNLPQFFSDPQMIDDANLKLIWLAPPKIFLLKNQNLEKKIWLSFGAK